MARRPRLQRSEEGFSLVSAILISVLTASAAIGGYAILMPALTAAQKNRFVMSARADAESALDYVVNDLSASAAANPNATSWGTYDAPPGSYKSTAVSPSIIQAASSAKINVLVRRVAAPSYSMFRNSPNAADFRLITVTDAQGPTQRKIAAVLQPTAPVSATNNSPFLNYGLFGKDLLNMSSNMCTDGYDSAKGVYTKAPSLVNRDPASGIIGSKVELGFPGGGNGEYVGGAVSWGTIKGYSNQYSFKGSDVRATGAISGITAAKVAAPGTIKANDATLGPAPTVPDAPTAPVTATNKGAWSITSSTPVAAGEYKCTSLTISGSGAIVPPATGKVVIYVENSTVGTPININGGKINNPSNRPGDVRIYSNTKSNVNVSPSGWTGEAANNIGGNGIFSAVVYTPYAKVTVGPNQSPGMFGSIVGASMDVPGNQGVIFHYDKALGSSGSSSSSSSSSTTSAGCLVTSWTEYNQ